VHLGITKCQELHLEAMSLRYYALCTWAGELASDIDMNEFVCLFYTKSGIFTEDLPFNKLFVLLFVASAKQNRLANIIIRDYQTLHSAFLSHSIYIFTEETIQSVSDFNHRK
jgi:hypothetical protein